MKQVAFLIMMLFVTKTYSAKLEIEELKTLFEAAAYSKASADRFLKLLSTVDHSSTPILICYKGVAEMMQAKYGFTTELYQTTSSSSNFTCWRSITPRPSITK